MLCVANNLILCISKYFRNNKNIYLYSKASVDVDSINSQSLNKLEEEKKEEKEEEHSIIDDNNNNKNNFKELGIKEIENMPIKDSNNIHVVFRKNSKESLLSKEKVTINFESLYQA